MVSILGFVITWTSDHNAIQFSLLTFQPGGSRVHPPRPEGEEEAFVQGLQEERSRRLELKAPPSQVQEQPAAARTGGQAHELTGMDSGVHFFNVLWYMKLFQLEDDEEVDDDDESKENRDCYFSDSDCEEEENGGQLKRPMGLIEKCRTALA